MVLGDLADVTLGVNSSVVSCLLNFDTIEVGYELFFGREADADGGTGTLLEMGNEVPCGSFFGRCSVGRARCQLSDYFIDFRPLMSQLLCLPLLTHSEKERIDGSNN